MTVNPTPDPTRTAEALFRRTDYSPAADPARYGTATTDPLGRTGTDKQSRLPKREDTTP